MSAAFRDLVRRVSEGERLSRGEAGAAIGAILGGEASELETAALLVAWKTRGESAEEVAGIVEHLRSRMKPVETTLEPLVDTCGTGGDGAGTFNVSTAAAFVVAGAGAYVAKHGNRAVSSRSGSADVLEALGVSLNGARERTAESLAEAGIVFLFAPHHHPALAKVASVRRSLGLRTVFNIVGPLVNPARVRRQVVGVYRRELMSLVAESLVETGSERAWVVHGDGGLDELTTTGPTRVLEVAEGGVVERTVIPEELGLERARVADLGGGDADANAGVLRAILDGQPGPKRDIVLLNAAAALVVAGLADDLPAGLERARRSIDEGRARLSLERLIAVTR